MKMAPPLPVDVTLLRRFTACCCYGAISIMITLFNKAVFSVYRFTYPNVVTTYQILVSIAYLLILQRLRWMDIGSLNLKSARQVHLIFVVALSCALCCGTGSFILWLASTCWAKASARETSS